MVPQKERGNLSTPSFPCPYRRKSLGAGAGSKVSSNHPGWEGVSRVLRGAVLNNKPYRGYAICRGGISSKAVSRTRGSRAIPVAVGGRRGLSQLNTVAR